MLLTRILLTPPLPISVFLAFGPNQRKLLAALHVVIMLHGTGGKKEDFKAEMEKYAQAGFLAVAIDGPYFGERAPSAKNPDAVKNADYEAAILAAWRTGQGHPFFYDTVWDVMRLVDYLQTRDDVDPKRIGLMGVSKRRH